MEVPVLGDVDPRLIKKLHAVKIKASFTFIVPLLSTRSLSAGWGQSRSGGQLLLF